MFRLAAYQYTLSLLSVQRHSVICCPLVNVSKVPGSKVDATSCMACYNLCGIVGIDVHALVGYI